MLYRAKMTLDETNERIWERFRISNENLYIFGKDDELTIFGAKSRRNASMRRDFYEERRYRNGGSTVSIFKKHMYVYETKKILYTTPPHIRTKFKKNVHSVKNIIIHVRTKFKKYIHTYKI